MEEVLNFLKANKSLYFLATVDESGKPHVRPFGTIDLYNGRLYIQTGLKKEVGKQLLANPAVELCAFNGAEWLRISAEAVYDPDDRAAEHMLDAYPELKEMYKVGDGNTAVFYLQNATAVFSSFTTEPRSVKF